MVSFVEGNGLLRFIPIGYHDVRLLLNQVVAVHTKKGLVRGVTGTRPPHLARRGEADCVVPLCDLFIDIGVGSAEEARLLGVEQGDVASFARVGGFLNGTCVYSGKSVDNRAGLAVMLDAMRRLRESRLGVKVFMVGTVQEEYGCRGALPVANRLRPDLAIALDVSIAGDVPCMDFREAPVRMGSGACVKFYESMGAAGPLGMAVPQRLTSALIAVAEEKGIPFQRDFMVGGVTDGSAINFAAQGILCGGISIPSRYIHSAVGLVNLEDMRCCSDLLVEYVKSL
jgi:endoglucanase